MRPIISVFFLVAVAAHAQQPVRRDVPDPGVIATGQRVNPAGVQSVFDGKVGGVRFGQSSDEIWVAVPGSVYRMDWRANTVRARARVDGRPGVHALSLDPATKRVFVTSVGRLPAPPGAGNARRPAVTQLSVFDGEARGDSAQPIFNSGALGDYMAGAPAVSPKPGADGKRLAVAPLPANDGLVVFDADAGTVIRTIALGVEPIAAVVSADSRVAYVSVLGGAKPKAGERASMQCCDARSEAVRVDPKGIAAPGSVSRIDLATGTVMRDIPVGRHPTAIVWDETRARLYVAEGNSDTISVIDTKADAVVARVGVAPFREKKIGLAPTALALAPDGTTLYVALGGVNAVAMYDVSGSAKLRGLIPTAWYPSSLDASSDGKFLAIGSLYGVGSGEGSVGAKRARYVFAVRGSVHVVPVPTDAPLLAFTTAVAENNRLALASAEAAVASRAVPRPKAVPDQPGDSSLINHVVFIVKENRTYDQVLGDLDRGSRDSTLTMFGRSVTPNAHAISQQFVTIDHFFASGGNSADGHQWLTQANETEYPMWPLYYGRSYPSEAEDALTYSSGGFLWEGAASKGKTVEIFGEYAPSPKTSSDSVRRRMLAQWRERPNDFDFHRSVLTGRFDTHSDIPSLDRALIREYPGWTQEVPDVIKAGDILSHLAEWESKKAMPNLTMIVLPNDHTQGTSAGWCTPSACVADNDFALGKIVEGLSHSTFWKDMAILVVEDDAQNGVDHIDGHRTVAMAISPYVKRGTVDSTFYSQPSMVKTVELMLGIPSMSIFDLVATDMRASFVDAGAAPDFTPYKAIEPEQSLFDVNVRAGSINGKFSEERRNAARASQRMSFAGPDEAPTEQLNRILWHEAKGWGTKYPAINRSLFFPLSIDIADEEREKRRPDRKKP